MSSNDVHFVAGLDVPIKFVRKKKHDSPPKPPPELNNVPARGTAHPANAESPPTHYSSTEKVETEPEEHFSSVAYSGEIYNDDHLFKLGQVLFPQLLPTSGILTKVQATPSPPFFMSLITFDSYHIDSHDSRTIPKTL